MNVNQHEISPAPTFVQDTQDNSCLQTKFFNDPIHGHIQLHPLLVKVVDTPQFQRLRNIKQLGGNYFVYPGASHNRFEHSIGTCYLAGKLARHLKEKHPSRVNDIDILCVELAGLCHDLGHGPYSHMFDMKFLPTINPKTKWKHEDASCMMFDHLIQDNKLEDEFEKYNLDLDKDVTFIKEMIKAPPDQENQEWKYKGRPRSKSFLYEIVSNERNKVDVDKWDYFARDCHHLGIKNSFDHNRFMQFLKVLTVAGEDPQICARDKECLNLYEMFHTRSILHRRAYQHGVASTIEKMICDAMLLANNHIKYAGKDGKMLSISDTITDMVAYEKLTDYVFFQILHSTDESEDMKKARKLLQSVLRRDLYKYVGQYKPPKGSPIKPSSSKCKEIEEELAALDRNLSPDDIVVNIKKFDFGMNKENPCDQFRFYSKHNPDAPYQIRREEISHMLPDTFEDCEVQVYCKTSDKKEAVKTCLFKWCKIKGFKPNTMECVASSLTPMKQTSKRANGNETKISAKVLKFLP